MSLWSLERQRAVTQRWTNRMTENGSLFAHQSTSLPDASPPPFHCQFIHLILFQNNIFITRSNSLEIQFKFRNYYDGIRIAIIRLDDIRILDPFTMAPRWSINRNDASNIWKCKIIGNFNWEKNGRYTPERKWRAMTSPFGSRDQSTRHHNVPFCFIAQFNGTRIDDIQYPVPKPRYICCSLYFCFDILFHCQILSNW